MLVATGSRIPNSQFEIRNSKFEIPWAEALGSDLHDLAYVAVRLDLLDQSLHEMVTEFHPVGKPAGDAVLRVAVGIEHRHELARGGPALAVLAHQRARGALGELVEVILDVADGAADAARGGVVGGQRDVADLGEGRGELAPPALRGRADLRDTLGLARGEQFVGAREDLLRLDAVALEVLPRAARR